MFCGYNLCISLFFMSPYTPDYNNNSTNHYDILREGFSTYFGSLLSTFSLLIVIPPFRKYNLKRIHRYLQFRIVALLVNLSDVFSKFYCLLDMLCVALYRQTCRYLPFNWWRVLYDNMCGWFINYCQSKQNRLVNRFYLSTLWIEGNKWFL